MKRQYVVLAFLLVFAALFTATAQKYPVTAVKKENIKVWGECGMCKKKIEAASKNAGALAADWNEDSKILSVSFNIFKTNATKIEEAVAAAGYDTRDVAANGGAYNKLPVCCHYERKQTVVRQAVNCCSNEITCARKTGCCKDNKCDAASIVCKDMVACKEKGCCKS